MLIIYILYHCYLRSDRTVSYTHLRAHETGRNLVCRLLLEKKKKKKNYNDIGFIKKNNS